MTRLKFDMTRPFVRLNLSSVNSFYLMASFSDICVDCYVKPAYLKLPKFNARREDVLIIQTTRNDSKNLTSSLPPAVMIRGKK